MVLLKELRRMFAPFLQTAKLPHSDFIVLRTATKSFVLVVERDARAKITRFTIAIEAKPRMLTHRRTPHQ
jgi:hypothetical protein